MGEGTNEKKKDNKQLIINTDQTVCHVCINEERLCRVEKKTDNMIPEFFEHLDKRDKRFEGKLDTLDDKLDTKASTKELNKATKQHKEDNSNLFKQIIAVMAIVLSIIVPIQVALLYIVVDVLGRIK